MRAFTAINRIKLLLFLSLFLVPACAQNTYSVKGDGATGSDMVVLREIKVSGEGNATKIEISADKPLTYTSYSLSDPYRTVIDLSQTDPGTVVIPQSEVNSLIKKIDLVSTELTGGSLVRITVETVKEVELAVTSDPNDKNKLLVTIPESSESITVAESKGLIPSTKEEESSQLSPAVDVAEVVTVPEKVSSANDPATLASPDASDMKSSAAFAASTLAGLDVTKDGIVINTGSKIGKYKYFTLSKPQRLVVDIYDIKNAVSVKSLPVGSFGIENARIGTYPDKVRIVFDSLRMLFPSFTLEKISNGLLVRMDEQSSSSPVEGESSGNPVVKNVATKPVSVSKGPAAVDSLDFQVIDGYSRIAVSLSGECEVVGPTKTVDGLTLVFSNCQLPKRLQRPFDTSAFPSVVKNITPYQIRTKGKNDTRIHVSLREASTYALNKQGSVYQLDIINPTQSIVKDTKPVKSSPLVVSGATIPVTAVTADKQSRFAQNISSQDDGADKKFSKKVYTGKRVTLEFADADIRKIFQLIAEVSNLNFLVGDDVSGTISIKLVNVPWDQALDVILETKGLGMKKEGNIVMIRPKGKIMSLADEELAARRAYERTLDLRTKIFDINFASVSDIAGQFQTFKSERGTISLDSRTNRVIVNDVEPSIERMANLLKALDIPEKQVLIEARIVEASSSFTQDLGIQWGIHYRDGSASMFGINSLDTGFGGIVTNVAPTTGLPAAAAAGGAMGLSFGKLTSNVQVDLRLSAAAEAGQVKIISTPKVVTLNNKAAKISQGQMIPYSTVSAEGTKTEFVEAALTLEVTPHITADGSVSMKIKASNNSAGSAATGVAPPINKKEATTELLVQNGETTVIGGIYVDTDTSTDSGVPFLMDIPLLGWLFKSNNQKKSKSELLIFITPKIVS
jgi:type IV pilus assembly protein PilQ